MIIDSATDGIFDKIGELIEKNHKEDSSGYRRFIYDSLCKRNLEKVEKSLGISRSDCNNLYNIFVDSLPKFNPQEKQSLIAYKYFLENGTWPFFYPIKEIYSLRTDQWLLDISIKMSKRLLDIEKI